MASLSAFEDALKQAVTPGPDRLLAGVAVAAAGLDLSDGTKKLKDYSTAQGTIELDPASTPVSTKTPMWVASCSKLVSSVAALQCVEQGLFSLDDPDDVDRLLPEWKNPDILTGFTEDGQPILQPAKQKITLRTMLTHTCGVGYDLLDPMLLKWRQSRGEDWLMMKASIPECLALPLLFEPGSRWQYGAGLDLAGLMVARANKCSFEEFLRKNIFDVLGMPDTSFYASHNDIGTRMMPVCTRPGPDKPLMEGAPPGAPLPDLNEPQDEFGGSGLCSTADDFIKLLKSLLSNDGKLLKAEGADVLLTASLSPSAQTSYDEYTAQTMAALKLAGQGQPWSHSPGGRVGLEDSESGLKAGWVSWGGAANLKWWIDREGGTCGFFATQLFPPEEAKHRFLNGLFQEAMVAELSRHAGRWMEARSLDESEHMELVSSSCISSYEEDCM